ncbi:hypothetical protein BGZ68_007962 [Mortierella alpina]|nr:hypothetical protein BGZ68_007962 [Mortierella alpina]
MGIRDLYKVLAQKNLKPPEADLHQLPPNCVIDIDFMGTSSLWSLTRRLMTEDYNQTTARTAGMKLASHVKNLFCDDGRVVTLHVDGTYNAEKQTEHDKRVAKSVKTQEKLDAALLHMRNRPEQGKYTCKTVLDKIKKTLAALFVLTQADKDSLCGAMASFDPDKVTVCRCETEADLCIARSLNRELVPGHRVVVSGDSDLLAYLPTERVLRSIPNTASFSWYTKDEVEKTLRLPSHQHFLLLAVVAANDYGGNVKTVGIITNCDIIRDLPAGTIDEMLEAYVTAASDHVGYQVDRTMFDASRRVLHDLVDTPLPLVDRNNQDFLDRLHVFRGLLSQRHENARQARASEPRQQEALPFYVAPHSHRNQFRPYFTSKDSILRSQKVVDLNTVKEHAPPPQRKSQSGPRPRKRQPAKKKKQQKHRAKGKEVEQPYKRQIQSSTKHDHGFMKNMLPRLSP